MKRLISVVLAVVMLVTVSGAALAGNGNGTPPGAHETINIIGVPHGMQDGWTGGNGSRIFVDREEMTTFYVYGGDRYEIVDHDGTDGMVGQPGRGEANAGLILPYDDDAWQVEIYVKLLGPMDSSVKWRSYYFGGATWIKITEFTMNRQDKKFQLKTNALLKDGFQDVIWELDEKTNFKHLQMRIYLTER